MSQTLVINGKEYVQSSVLALQYAYTPDYIGKLAREEKIIGTQVGRQWFIEPESLNVFVQKSAIEKEIRAEELRNRRKIEHKTFKDEQSRSERGIFLPAAISASLQATLVIACGLLVGSLGFVASTSGVGMEQIASASRQTAHFVVQSLSPLRTVGSFEIKSDSFLAASQEGVRGQKNIQVDMPVKQVFTVLPEKSADATSKDVLVASGTAPSTSASDISRQFSDEVMTVTDQNGNKYLKPVFKDKNSSSDLYMVVPVQAE